MDKHEKLDEALEKMREENAANNAATPPPDWGKLEQNVILRLVRQVKARRVVIIALTTILVSGIAVLVAWKLFIPKMESARVAVWHLGQVEVSEVKPKEDKEDAEPYYSFVTNGYHHEGENDYFALKKLKEPIDGCDYIAEVYDEQDSYYFLVGKGEPPDRFYDVVGQRADKASGISYAMKGVANEARAYKFWPAPLWKLYPTVKLISEGKYEMVSPGPYRGFLRGSKLCYGNQYVYSLRVANWNNTFEAASIEGSYWPDKYVISTIGSYMVLEGDGAGYRLYEDARFWGKYPKERLVGIKESIWSTKELLGYSIEPASPELVSLISRAENIVVLQGPEYLKSGDGQALRRMTKPWFWEGWDDEKVKAIKGSLRYGPAKLPGKAGDVEFSKPEKEELQLQRGNYSLTFPLSSGQKSVGTTVDFTVKGEKELSFDVRHLDPFPVLTRKFDAKTEKSLSEAASIAKGVLAVPSASWPKTTIPEIFLKNWLTAIAERRIVYHEEDYDIFVYSVLKWEGDSAELVMNLGSYKTQDLNVKFGKDVFSVYLVSSGSIITSISGKLEAMQAEGNSNPVMTERDKERLSACAKSLLAYPEHKRAKPTPESDSYGEGNLAVVLPSSIFGGIKMLDEFLKNPVLPEVKKVAELPPADWSWEAMQKLERASPLWGNIE